MQRHYTIYYTPYVSPLCFLTHPWLENRSPVCPLVANYLIGALLDSFFTPRAHPSVYLGAHQTQHHGAATVTTATT